MRRFNAGETQKRQKGVANTNCAANMPNFQPLSSKVSIGTIDVFPTKQVFYVNTPFNDAMERTVLAQSLQCKEVGDLVAPETKLGGVLNNLRYKGCKPLFGGQRGDPKGLNYDKMYPIDTPLLQQTDSFFSYLKSPIR